jgi:hypothetical protein
MDRARVEFSLFPAGLRSDVLTANGVRTSRLQHAVEDCHADLRFSLLTRSQPMPGRQWKASKSFSEPVES